MNGTKVFLWFAAGAFLVTAGVLYQKRLELAETEATRPAPVDTVTPSSPNAPALSAKPAPVVAAPGLSPGDGLPQPGGTTPQGLPCDVTLAAKPLPEGQVALRLQANCALSRLLTVRHAGLVFSGQTDERGGFRVVVPALEPRAAFEIQLADAQTVTVHVSVPKAARYRRVVLQWQGDAGIALHARAFGASYGGAGHVWSGAPGSSASSGSLSQLGDPTLPNGHRAQIYSIAEDADRTRGVVRISVEAEVTSKNCSKVVEAETLQPGLAGIQRAGLILNMPDCTAIGEFLVLKHVLRDLKYAQN